MEYLHSKSQYEIQKLNAELEMQRKMLRKATGNQEPKVVMVELSRKVEKQGAEVEELKQQIQYMGGTIQNQNTTITDQRQKISELQHTISEQQHTISEQQHTISEQHQRIVSLEESAVLQNERQNRMDEIMAQMRKRLDEFLP